MEKGNGEWSKVMERKRVWAKRRKERSDSTAARKLLRKEKECNRKLIFKAGLLGEVKTFHLSL
jgi:hypothetical protein